MVATVERRRYSSVSHPLHLLLLGGFVALCLGAVISDITYALSYHIQWQNFASWFIVGSLFVGGAAIVCALLDLAPKRRTRGTVIHALVLAAAWIVGLFNVLWHARDAWASMPVGLVLSVIGFLLACAAAWFACSPPRIGGVE